MASFQEIKKYIYEMSEFRNEADRSGTCMYRGNDKYCRMTGYNSCNRCNFYAPTTQATFEAMYNEMQLVQEAYASTSKVMEKMEDFEEVLKEMHRLYDQAIQAYQKLYITESSLTAIWQDSVNSYE